MFKFILRLRIMPVAIFVAVLIVSVKIGDDPAVKEAYAKMLQRMAAVDRNVLRLAAYEMLFRDDIPPIVSINEAVDIAKKFSTHDSGKFVNGILDKVKETILPCKCSRRCRSITR